MTYSDRFIPSRASSMRLNFSVFDRETAASEPQKPPDKDVRLTVKEPSCAQMLVPTIVPACSVSLGG